MQEKRTGIKGAILPEFSRITAIKGSIIKFVGFRVSDILPSAFIHYL